jgi:Xaa-Pro aminopeptidase
MKSQILKRIQKYQKLLNQKKLDILIITSSPHIFYLTNYQIQDPQVRQAIVVIEKTQVKIIIHPMFQNQQNNIFSPIATHISQKPIFQEIKTIIKNRIVGIEDLDLKVYEYDLFKKDAKSLIPISKYIQKFRSQKSEEESEKIKVAQQITINSLINTIPKIKIGLTEKQISKIIENEMEKLGADELAFPTIVASGVNSSNPHHISGGKKIQFNEIILIDLGAKKDGYCGDLTRTYFFGSPNKKFTDIYNLVQKAQKTAINSIKPDTKIGDIDKIVRKIFSKYQDNILHTSGHGVGINVHEYPSIHYLEKNNLKENMILAVEPGLYFKYWGGIRIEDLVKVTKDGSEVIGELTKSLEDIIIPIR